MRVVVSLLPDSLPVSRSSLAKKYRAMLQHSEDSMVSDAPRTEPDSLFQQERRLSREQTIEQIRSMNPGASHEYLDRFLTPALSLYLEHLNVTQEPRGTVWDRPGDTPAILTRNPRD